VGGVHEAVEEGIGNCGIANHLVPVIDGQLAGHDGRSAAVAIVGRTNLTVERREEGAHFYAA
jgi:hypothetical protein